MVAFLLFPKNSQILIILSYKEMEIEHEKLDEENCIYQEGDEKGEEEQESTDSIFSPQIESLLWRRISEKGTNEFLVKYKDFSYLHVEWLEEAEILASSKNAKSKIIRFNKQFHKKKADLVRIFILTKNSKISIGFSSIFS